MSARTTAGGGEIADGGGRRCQAPSCWEPAETVEVADREVSDVPVLCETHRRAYLGVSS